MEFKPNPLDIIAMDIMVNELFDGVNNGEVSFEDEVIQQCIASCCLVGQLKLLRVCARELTDSHKDYKVVMKFIDRLQVVRDKETAKGSIEVVE